MTIATTADVILVMTAVGTALVIGCIDGIATAIMGIRIATVEMIVPATVDIFLTRLGTRHSRIVCFAQKLCDPMPPLIIRIVS